MKLQVGRKSSYRRTFTLEDVRAFAEISGDKGVHHMKPDGKGRIMVQGLLTATLPTKLGGDLNYIAREMAFEFSRPVFVGDTITCEGLVEKVVPETGRLNVLMTVVCRNQDGKEVLRGRTDGIIRT
ncbi:MAG: MaoC family dehydratase N-terminal domain-containing protein [Thaumarchaeota archaeon]|nr:MaoC family dehydratase N-terminal domain-containing protein [Nitrososphaerota archaeon]